MPNWCNNKLSVAGEAGEIQKFIQANLIDGTLQFGALVPRPDEFNKGNDWYEWNIANWGTKWELRKEEGIEFVSKFDENGTSSECFFGTAWAPPVPWAITVSKLFPDLTIRLWYDEPGSGFSGLTEIKNGEVSDASWEGESTEYSVCSAPGCEETAWGVPAWERKNELDIKNIYCEEYHQLESAVAEVVRKDEEEV